MEAQEQGARAGSTVLIDINDGDRLTFARLHPSASLKLGNATCSLSPLLDAPYGCAFQLQKGHLVRLSAEAEEGKEEARTFRADPPPCDLSLSPARDNRSLIDDNTAQKLSSQDIDRMRADCASGKEIVDALVANSATFGGKTAYSQEKYKKKKQKKYAPFLVMRRPSARRVCEAYALKNPAKIGFLRMDTLALTLSLGNVGAHAEVLVMDMASGLLTAAAAERIGGFGSVCSVYCGMKTPPLDIVGLLNLTPTMASRVFRVSIWELTSFFKGDICGQDLPSSKESYTGSSEQTKDADAHSVDDNSQKCVEGSHETANSSPDGEPKLTLRIEGMHTIDCSSDVAAIQDEMSIVDENEQDNAKARGQTKNLTVARYGRKPDPEDLARWARQGFTGLLVGALEYEPWSALQILLPLLSPSSPFVIYHRYLQPLADCMRELQVNKMAIALEIIEPWLREYQVLPSRTHPHMQMNATGGYILTGIKIALN